MTYPCSAGDEFVRYGDLAGNRDRDDVRVRDRDRVRDGARDSVRHYHALLNRHTRHQQLQNDRLSKPLMKKYFHCPKI